MKIVAIDKKFVNTIPGDLITIDEKTNPQVYSNKTATRIARTVARTFIEFRDGSYWNPMGGIYNANHRTYILTIWSTEKEKVDIEVVGDYPLEKLISKEALAERVVDLF